MNFTEGMVFGENSIWIFGRASGLWSGNRSACFFVVPGKILGDALHMAVYSVFCILLQENMLRSTQNEKYVLTNNII